MRALFICEDDLSKLFWGAVHDLIDIIPDLDSKLDQILGVTRDIQRNFPADQAGTIDRRTSKELYALSRYFQPRIVCEVGTYIGRSALIVSSGAGGTVTELHTCDYSFDQFILPPDIEGDYVARSALHYYPKTGSTQMFDQMIPRMKGLVDFFFIDGRLNSDDVMRIAELMSKDAVIVLDDFEGVEKGVINAVALATELKNYVLIRPSLSLTSSGRQLLGKTALMLPANLLRITRQQRQPFGSF